MKITMITKGKYHIVGSMFFSLFFTLLITTLSNSISAFVDSLCVARYLGEAASAAYSLSKPTFKFLTIFTGIVSSGLTVVIGSEISKGNIKKANKIFTSLFLICLLVGVVLAILGLTIPQYIAMAFGAGQVDSQLNIDTTGFIKGLLIGAPFYLTFTALLPTYSFDGAKSLVKICASISVVFNIVFDILNGEVFKLGTFGMGLATSIGYVIAFCPMFIRLFLKKSRLKLDFKNFSFKEPWSVFVYGSPKAIAKLCNSFGGLIINIVMIAVGGSIALSAASVQNSIFSIFGVLTACIAPAFLSIMNLYKLDHDVESSLHLLKIISIYLLVICIPIIALGIGLAPFIVRLFHFSNAEVIRQSTLSIQITLLTIPLSVITSLFLTYLQMLKKLKLIYLYTVINSFIVPISMLALFGYTCGTVGLWIAYPVTTLANILIAYIIECIRKKKLLPPLRTLLPIKEMIGDEKNKTYHFNVKSVEETIYHIEQIEKFLKDNNINEEDIKLAKQAIDNAVQIENIFGPGKNKKFYMDCAVFIEEEHLKVRIRDNNSVLSATKRAEIYANRKEQAKTNKNIVMLDELIKEINVVDYLNIHNTVYTIY